jgi:cytoskeletal protein RodZ
MPTPSDLSDRPVFVDPSGRRRRVARRIAIGVCAVLAVYVILLCAALSGAPIPPSALLPLPADTVTSTTSDVPNPQVTGSTTTSKASGVTTSASPSLNRTTTSAPAVVTTTAATTTTVGNRNSHAPTTPPGHAKHTETTTPGP